mmetsp:Transcript_38760/g.66179  ORF Transcript_38760/g.66179 Transcript_38760/m.66179 type:complete len:161 (+) Transcript_38760:126-608(+)
MPLGGGYGGTFEFHSQSEDDKSKTSDASSVGRHPRVPLLAASFEVLSPIILHRRRLHVGQSQLFYCHGKQPAHEVQIVVIIAQGNGPALEQQQSSHLSPSNTPSARLGSIAIPLLCRLPTCFKLLPVPVDVPAEDRPPLVPLVVVRTLECRPYDDRAPGP